MNKTKIRKYQIFSILFTFILGTLLHFTYTWSGENSIVAIFSSINESVWEHLKLLFFPMVLTIIIGYFYIGKNISNFICSKTLGVIIAMLFLVIFHYTYSGIIGKTIPFIDIALFFISTILGEFVSYILIVNRFKCNNVIAIVVLVSIFIAFVAFTYITPNIGIFKDPLTGNYGISEKKCHCAIVDGEN